MASDSARIDDNSNDGDDIRISFTTSVNYVGFYIIDLNGSSSTHQVRVNYSDGTLCNFTIDGTDENCQCEEFLGIVAPTGKLIQNVELYPNGGSQYGIDNLMYGTILINSCPKLIEFNMDNCNVGDLAPNGWPAEFVSSNCNLNVGNLYRQVGANSCGSGNQSMGTNMCFNGQNSSNWVDNDPDALRFNVVLGASQSLQLTTLEIRQGVFQNCPGASTLNNYPRLDYN